MKILFVAPRLPLPADTGAKIRTFNLLKNILQGNEVTLVSFYFVDDEKSVRVLRELGIKVHLVKVAERINPFTLFDALPIAIAKYRSEEMKKELRGVLSSGRFNLVHFDHLHMAQYRECIGNLPCVVDEHNVESMILERCTPVEKSALKKIIYRFQAVKMKKFEAEAIQEFSRCLAVSENDRAVLLKLSDNRAHVEVIPNGVDTGYFSKGIASRTPAADARNDKENSLVFTGSMDWLPNSDAVEYFCNDILPLIWEKKRDVKFYVVGKNPAKKMSELGKKNKRIIVTGGVDDVRPYMEKAKVFVVPLRIGGGTRLKILEAMSMQKAVVSTSIGAEGIAYTENSDIILADNPQDFADKVLSLLENDKRADEIGLRGRKLVCDKYDWRIIGGMLNDVYKNVMTGEQHG